jgi:hypothetical protein
MDLSKGLTPEEGKWNNQDLKLTIQWYTSSGHTAMPKNKEGLILRYRETCCRIVPTYQYDAGVTEAAPRQAVATDSYSNPNLTATPHKNFAAAALQDEPAALAPAPIPALGTEAEITLSLGNEADTEDQTTASATILALDHAARTIRPKCDTEDDTEDDTPLPPALNCATP